MARFRTDETQISAGTLDGPRLNEDELRTLASVGSHI